MSCKNDLSPEVVATQEINTGIPSSETSTPLYFPGRTAMSWPTGSVPARFLLNSKLITVATKVLDWGCGKGRDVRFFQEEGVQAFGFDPNHGEIHSPEVFQQEGIDTITCSYVLNVVTEDLRQQIVQEIADFLPPKGKAFFSVRSEREIKEALKPSWQAHQDGWLTSSQTFQKGFQPPELIALLTPYFETIQLIKKDPLIVMVTKKSEKNVL